MMKLTERKKLLIYKLLIVLFAFVLAFLPSTVSRNLEVNSRVIVEMIGLDKTDDGIEVTAQYVMPTATDGATTKDKVNVSAQNVTQAVEMLSTALGRRAELGHCSMLIIGDGLKPDTLASLMTGTDVTADVYVSGAENSAGKLVGVLTDFMKKNGATDADFIAYSAKRSHIATTTLMSFLSDLGSESKTAFVPIVELIEEEDESGKSEEGESGENGGEKSGGESGGEKSEKKEKQAIGMKTEKLALYGEDGRVGVLEGDAARGVAWMSAPVEKSIVTADVSYDGREYSGVSAQLSKKRVSLELDKKNRACVLKVVASVYPKCDTFNYINTSSDGMARQAIKEGFERTIRAEIERGYRDALAVGSDPMFIVRKFHRYAPGLGVTREGLDGVDVKIDVRVEIN